MRCGRRVHGLGVALCRSTGSEGVLFKGTPAKGKEIIKSPGALVLLDRSFEVHRLLRPRCLRAVSARLIALLVVEVGTSSRGASMKPLPPWLICSGVQQPGYKLLHDLCRNQIVLLLVAVMQQDIEFFQGL